MKNLLQKALAGWLSVVTVFGASVPALASGGGKIDSGSVTGRVISNEGAIPPNVIEIEMPTRREGMFDFIIDPSGAILSSNAARYKEQYGNDVTFDSGKLFFQNYSEDENGGAHISYSNRSDSLIVTNKGNVPLDVELTLDVDKGDYDFEFAAAPDFTDEEGVEIPGAAMYMALVTEKREAAVAPVSVEEDGVTSVKYRASVQSWLAPPQDAYKIVWADDAYRYKMKDDLPDSLFDRTSFYVTGALGEGVWDGAKEEIVMNIAWTVIPRESESLENPFSVPSSSPNLQSVTYAYKNGETAKIMVDFGSGEDAMTTVMGIAYAMEDGTTGFVDADSMTISPYPSNECQSLVELTVSGDLFDAVSWAVRLADDDGETVELPLQLVLDIMKPTATVIDRATTIGGRSEIRVHWGIMNAIDGITYTTLSGDSAEIPASAVEIDGEMSDDNTVYVTLDETSAKGSDFVLTMTNDEGETAEFTLDLSNYTVEPTVEVAEKASASAPAATITVDWGIGSKAMSAVKKVTYTTPSGDAAEITDSDITVSGETISVKFNATSIKGSGYTLVLTNAKGATFEAEVDLVDPIDPTVTVTHTATSATDSAAMTVDWGAGSKAMSSVQKVTYVNASGAAAEISGDDRITVDGDTVSVKFDATSIMGTNFKVVLTNASGATFTQDVELVHAKDPTVEVTQKANASGDFAAMTVEWGSGELAMSSVKQMTYTNASGAAAEIASSDITVIGNTISVQIDETSLTGTNFKLILTNINGGIFEAEVDLVNAVDPTAAVTQKATASGDSATITVNWGAGSKAMSSVSKVTYTNASGAAAEITGSAITVDGDTISVKFTQASITGTGFKLVLKNAGNATFETAVDLVNAVDPTVTVTKQASASGESATITVDWGSGSKAMSSVSKVTYTTIAGAAAEITGSANITVSGDTVSVKFDQTSVRGANFKLILKNASDATFETAVDLVNAVDPTATVTKQASASGNSATVTVDWGAGSKAMSSVKQVTYTNVLNKAATIGASDITVNGNTVSVPFDETSIRGTNFKLVLTNEGGKTFETEVDLVKAVDPTATVTSKATAAGETSTVTVNWGAGSKAMSSVSKVTYTTVLGAAAQISGSAKITTSGDTVTVKFDETSIKGNDFKLVLTKASGETAEIAVDLANYEEPPSATVTSKATAPGQSATIAVSWGVGSRAMTSVSKVTYTDASGAPAEITTADITTNGATVSVKFNRTSIQGTDFKLILTNAKGATSALPLDLAAFDPSTGLGAEASVTKQAKTSSKTATIIVDWGTGESAMTSVDKITFKQQNGSAAEIKSGTSYLTVEGDILTVKFTTSTIKGTDFVLVLKNDSNDILEIPVDLVES